MADSPRIERVRETLTAAVRIATGNPAAGPRPGQSLLTDDVARASDPLGGQAAGIAPTGSGKSLAGLSVAAVGVVDYGERWLMSTESIGLQAQYVDKDGPVISQAAEQVLGKPVKVAMLKGWSNHVCAMKARDSARQLGFPVNPAESKIVAHAARVSRANLPAEVSIDGETMPSSVVQPLIAWALRQHASEELPADRGHYEGATSDVEWRAVSVTPQECVGEDECPLAAICKPLQARQRAAEADIVITNHSMLAVQAATGTPVVIGNSKLGPFQGIIVDEAHTLPGIVRAQGQSFISGRRIMNLRSKVRALSDQHDAQALQWAEDGKALASYVDDELRRRVGRGAKESVRIPEDQDPLADTGDLIDTWVKAGQKFAQNASKIKGDMGKMRQAKRVLTELEQAGKDLDSVRQHWVGTARWLEPPTAAVPGAREWASVQSAPVHVGGMINRNLWNETIRSDNEDEDEQRPLTVACISATLPEGFAREVGLKVPTRAYPSPFTDAYAASRLFIPRAVDAADVDALGTPGYKEKVKFDTRKHREWAEKHILKLVEANSGSALILSAKSEDGKKYAAALRAESRGRWKVYSQWDGENPRVITQKWKNDPTSVMVGTKSLMTGVDAPGETNTLVIVDRAPRAASNPVDDARVEQLMEFYDKWGADRLVYVSDAALLLEQAAGRLIRSTSDSGMVAVLDPRMLNAGPFSYAAPVRNTYQRALEQFPNKISDPAKALSWLRDRKVAAAR